MTGCDARPVTLPTGIMRKLVDNNNPAVDKFANPGGIAC